MIQLSESRLEELRRAAGEATRDWSSAKATMALRAVGLDLAQKERETLEAIAETFGVSRETVRRARNELLDEMELPAGATSDTVYAALSVPMPAEPAATPPAAARALRRVLTMTGPLMWDEVLSAWARAGGKYPYSPLPAEFATMYAWAKDAGGFTVVSGGSAEYRATIGAREREDLDQVSQFLFDALRGQAGGVDRNELLEGAAEASLKPTTIANALSLHPAVARVGRGRWALRGHRLSAPDAPTHLTANPPRTRVRPTAFSWGPDGSLQIEFSVPRGPSPVLAVPKAVAAIVEGRDFVVASGGKRRSLTVRNARMWGFGPLLSATIFPSGTRATIALNLVSGTATIAPTKEKDATR